VLLEVGGDCAQLPAEAKRMTLHRAVSGRFDFDDRRTWDVILHQRENGKPAADRESPRQRPCVRGNRPGLYAVIPRHALVADSVCCDYDPINKKADIGSSFLERD
jgi:hypothetical protein